MITPLTAIVTFHGRGRWSHRASAGRSSIAAPIDQTPASRKQTVGGIRVRDPLDVGAEQALRVRADAGEPFVPNVAEELPQRRVRQ